MALDGPASLRTDSFKLEEVENHPGEVLSNSVRAVPHAFRESRQEGSAPQKSRYPHRGQPAHDPRVRTRRSVAPSGREREMGKLGKCPVNHVDVELAASENRRR